MSRRFTQSSSSGLDSDSFLDVVANLVGILIILVVVAGLKVSQTPPTPVGTAERAEIGEPSHSAVPPEVEPGLIVEAPALPAAVAEEAVPLPPAELPAIPTVEPPTELVQRVEALEESLARAETSLVTASSRLSDLVHTQESLEVRALTADADLRSEDERLATEQTRLNRMQAYLRERGSRLERMRAQATAISLPETSEPKRLGHSLTPIAKAVEQREIMLYLSGNRVSVMPWDELIALAVDELRRTTPRIPQPMPERSGGAYVYSQTITLPGSQAVSHVTLGPIAGFHLACKRGRLAQGDSMFTSFEFVPENDLRGETAEEAFKAGSEFLHAVESAGQEATLTFWVYPDSFETYHKLREVCQQRGLHVAGRPMPFGVHVGGSPDGSRSVSQ